MIYSLTSEGWKGTIGADEAENPFSTCHMLVTSVRFSHKSVSFLKGENNSVLSGNNTTQKTLCDYVQHTFCSLHL